MWSLLRGIVLEFLNEGKSSWSAGLVWTSFWNFSRVFYGNLINFLLFLQNLEKNEFSYNL